MPKLDLATVPVRTGSIYPAPCAAVMAGRSSPRLAGADALSQFGANLVTLDPGARSLLCHWHAHEDEPGLFSEGICTLITDAGAEPMHPGDCAAFPARLPNGHRLDNRSTQPDRTLVIGTRCTTDRIHYTNHGLLTEMDGPARRYLHRDGTPFGDAK